MMMLSNRLGGIFRPALAGMYRTFFYRNIIRGYVGMSMIVQADTNRLRA